MSNENEVELSEEERCEECVRCAQCGALLPVSDGLHCCYWDYRRYHELNGEGCSAKLYPNCKGTGRQLAPQPFPAAVIGSVAASLPTDPDDEALIDRLMAKRAGKPAAPAEQKGRNDETTAQRPCNSYRKSGAAVGVTDPGAETPEVGCSACGSALGYHERGCPERGTAPPNAPAEAERVYPEGAGFWERKARDLEAQLAAANAERDHWKRCYDGAHADRDDLFAKLAAANAENERLKAERDDWRGKAASASAAYVELRAFDAKAGPYEEALEKLSALTAESERLRSALQRIDDHESLWSAATMAFEARSALAASAGGQGKGGEDAG